MLIDKDYYWYFKNAIGSKTCDDIIKLGLEKKPKLAETEGYLYKTISKKTMLNKRHSKTVFLKEKWIENFMIPLIQEANRRSFWNYQLDFLQDAQFTIYAKNQHYGWHQDFSIHSFPYERQFRQEENGKVRKLSLTCQLNDPSEFEGGEFEFDFRNYDPDKRKKKHGLEATEVRSKGSVIVFPSYVWHRVKPITKGSRYSLVMWALGKPWQ